MTIVKGVLVLLHFIGFAALLGGLLVQVREPAKKVLPVMRDGIGTAFVAGLLIVGVLEMTRDDLPGYFHAKIAVKFTIALIILVLVMVNMRKPRIPDGLFWGLLGLTVLNMGVAVLWH